MKSDRILIGHIRESIRRILDYTAPGKAAFLAEPMIQDAVLRNLEIIGEATKRLSPDLRDRHPDIPWRSMAALRDVLAHGYMSVDLEIVWDVVENRLGDLNERIQALPDLLS